MKRGRCATGINRPEGKPLMFSSSSKFLADYFTNCRFIEWLFPFRKIFSKCFVDHCLVTITRLIGSFTEIIEDVRVKVHCHSGFTLGGYNLASFGIFKIMFLFHIVSFAMASPFWLKSSAWYRHDKNKQPPLFDQRHRYQRSQIAVHLHALALQESWQMGRKALIRHRRSVPYAF